MKNFTLILLLFSTIYCNAQNAVKFSFDHFETQLLSYQPNRNSNVSQKDFDYGKMIINQTQSRIKNNKENFDRADYFNVLSAFLSLKENVENIKIAFIKFEDAEGSCEYFLSFEKDIESNSIYDIIREDVKKKIEMCKSNSVVKKKMDAVKDRTTNKLDLALVKKINQVHIDDQKYRNKTSQEFQIKQQKLDNQNQKIIDSLYNMHKTYIGRSFVGEKFKSVMWAVIQHSNPEMMEEYLPDVHKAVINDELETGALKMLIDRTYWLKYGYQIFGSQPGIKLADEKTRKATELKYGIK